MKAAVLYAPYDLKVEERAVPSPNNGWVTIAVEAAGICGTDIAVYEGKYAASLPRVLGHEFCGRILAIGDEVHGLEPGQRVMAEGSWCGDEQHGTDESTHDPCINHQALGRTVDGCFSEAVAVPSGTVHLLPNTVKATEAQSVTTLATAVRAVQRAGTLADKRVAIVGPGHAGLLLLQVCLVFGAQGVAVVGTRENRLQVAKQLGAESASNIRLPSHKTWLQEPANRDFDVVFEASGTASGLATCFELARKGGRIVSYGIISGPLDSVPGQEIYSKELTILGSRGAEGCYEEAIRLLASGLISVEPLITHVIPIQNAEEGFTIATQRLPDALRIVFVP